MSTILWRTIFASLLLFSFASVSSAQISRKDLQKRETLGRMMKTIDVSLEEVRMEDFVDFMKNATNADISPYWESDNRPSGLVKDALITIDARGISALDLMERVLERPGVLSDEFDEATWQMSPSGAFEIGPRSRLNRRQSRQVYDVRDLLFIFNKNQTPAGIDLDSALDGSNGGGGGGGLFGGSGGGGGDSNDINLGTDSGDTLDNLIEIIMDEIEPDQWELTAGEGASLRVFRGDLLIRAPDYIHRQIIGYKWWPDSAFAARETPRVLALREYGYDAVADGTVSYEPAPAVFDEDDVYVRVGPLEDDSEDAEIQGVDESGAEAGSAAETS